MLKFIFNKNNQAKLAVMFLLSSMFPAVAGSYLAYEGKFNAYVLSVEAANVINVSVDVWAGFPRTFRVTLPNTAVPINHPKAPACQLELVQKALDFTNDFLKNAKKVEVRNIKLKKSSDTDIELNIYTEKGSLAQKLKAAGLARPVSVDKLKPWC